jgi:hypothetical protein
LTKKKLVLALEAALVLFVLYLSAQTLCDINLVDIAPEPATSSKACSFPLPRIPIPDCPACEKAVKKVREWVMAN